MRPLNTMNFFLFHFLMSVFGNFSFKFFCFEAITIYLAINKGFYVQLFTASYDINFGYEEDDGPHKWPGVCNTGARQSPIDISSSAIVVENLPRIHFVHYAHAGELHVENNGLTCLFIIL